MTKDSDRHALAEARREAGAWRNRFGALLDRTPVPIAICTGDGVIAELNPAFATLLGTSPARAHGRPITDLLQAKVHRDHERLTEQLRSRRRTRASITVRWPTGTGELTVQTVVAGDIWKGLLLTLQPSTPVPAGAPELSDREIEILRLIAGGATSAETAAELGLTPDGVNYHLTRLTARLGVANRTALVARAYTLGLLDPAAWPPR